MILQNVLTVGSIGCLVFTVFLIIMATSGMAAKVRDKEGNFRKERSWKMQLGILLFLVFLLAILQFGNYRLIQLVGEKPSLAALWVNAFGIFLLIHLYDLVIIDYLIIVKWHPKFLKLPDTDYYRTIQPHIKGFFQGLRIGILASLVVSVISYLL